MDSEEHLAGHVEFLYLFFMMHCDGCGRYETFDQHPMPQSEQGIWEWATLVAPIAAGQGWHMDHDQRGYPRCRCRECAARSAG